MCTLAMPSRVNRPPFILCINKTQALVRLGFGKNKKNEKTLKFPISKKSLKNANLGTELGIPLNIFLGSKPILSLKF